MTNIKETKSIKLIIQIPCFNEAKTLPETITALPQNLPGIKSIEILVIDDGSTDETTLVAKQLGVQHVIQLSQHRGLANSFVVGLEASLARNADIIVNTDADNQYYAEDIQKIIAPILSGKADIAIGDRGVASVASFSQLKRALQRLGSWVLRLASGFHTPDATSGFRALSRDAAFRTIVLSEYSYTLETLIQAGARNMSVVYVPVRTNPPSRPSRLINSTSEYLAYSTATILRSYTMYRPLRVFTMVGSLFIILGMFLGARFIYLRYFIEAGSGNVQSLILVAILLIIGFQIWMIGLLADLVGFNRKILEEVLYRIRKVELDVRADEDKHTK